MLLRRLVSPVTLATLLLLGDPAVAVEGGQEPITLRMAAIAPDGTGWARELHALARELETATEGAVVMKWYLGGIAGDEMSALARIRRGQLDGAAGALFCGTISPTLSVTRVAGLVQSRDESRVLLNRLRPRIDAEFKERGMVSIVVGAFGNDVMFLRRRVADFAELQKTPMWIWNADTILQKQMSLMGMNLKPANVEELSDMYDRGDIDGTFVIPTAALAFQWTTRVKFFVDLRSSSLAGCLTLSQKAYDQLTFAQQQALTAAAARFAIRFDELGRREDALLLGGALTQQGLKKMEATESLRAAFLKAAAVARDQLDERTLPRELLDLITSILEDYRAEHRRP